MAKTPRYVSTFRAPTEYERQLEEARRRQAMAEALAQQEYQPMEGVAAPIPRAAPLVKALQGFLTAREGRKAREAAEEAKGMEETYAQRMLGRMEGGYTYDPAAATPMPIPEQTELGEVTRQSQYVRAPEQALAMASTGLGAAALKDRPVMAERLAMMLKEPEKAKSPYGSVDPSKFTQSSLQKFDASVQAGSPDYTLLQSREYAELTPQQQYDIMFKGGQFGLDAARFGYETGLPSPQIPRFPFQSGQSAAPPQMGPPAAAPQMGPQPQTAMGAGNLSPKARQEIEAQLLKENVSTTQTQLTNAKKAQEGLEKTYRALDLLEQGQPITGVGADIRLMGERVKSLFTGQPLSQVSDSQLLDALLGSEVFGYIQSLGIGSRGLDTPAEKDFLLSVMTGTRQLDNETLREMTKLRAKVLENNLDAINERINSGDLDWYYQLQAPYGVRKRPFERPARKTPSNADPVFDKANEILRRSGF
jgi:hypothetical protein